MSEGWEQIVYDMVEERERLRDEMISLDTAIDALRRMYAKTADNPQNGVTARPAREGSSRGFYSKNSVPVKELLRKVITEAEGPLFTGAVAQRCLDIGWITTSKDPRGAIYQYLWWWKKLEPRLINGDHGWVLLKGEIDETTAINVGHSDRLPDDPLMGAPF